MHPISTTNDVSPYSAALVGVPGPESLVQLFVFRLHGYHPRWHFWWAGHGPGIPVTEAEKLKGWKSQSSTMKREGFWRRIALIIWDSSNWTWLKTIQGSTSAIPACKNTHLFEVSFAMYFMDLPLHLGGMWSEVMVPHSWSLICDIRCGFGKDTQMGRSFNPDSCGGWNMLRDDGIPKLFFDMFSRTQRVIGEWWRQNGANMHQDCSNASNNKQPSWLPQEETWKHKNMSGLFEKSLKSENICSSVSSAGSSSTLLPSAYPRSSTPPHRLNMSCCGGFDCQSCKQKIEQVDSNFKDQGFKQQHKLVLLEQLSVPLSGLNQDISPWNGP